MVPTGPLGWEIIPCSAAQWATLLPSSNGIGVETAEEGGDSTGFVIQLGVGEAGFDGVGICQEGQGGPIRVFAGPTAQEFNQSGATRDRWQCLLGNHRGYLRSCLPRKACRRQMEWKRWQEPKGGPLLGEILDRSLTE